MEMLKNMKTTLMAQAQAQMGNLQSVDAKELGEVIDMIKDLEEAIYYCTIVKAMEEKEEKPAMYYTTPSFDYNRDMDRYYGKMYYNGSGNSSSGTSGNGGSTRSYLEYNYPRYYQDGNNQSSGESRNYMEMPIELRDRREGRSPVSRRSYMEAKEMHHDKSKKIQELEKYMQELATDVVEMIEDASPEEKQMLHKKMTALTQKIEQI